MPQCVCKFDFCAVELSFYVRGLRLINISLLLLLLDISVSSCFVYYTHCKALCVFWGPRPALLL